MTSRLSSDDIQQLAPLLGSLARLIAGGSKLREDELRVLLMGTDIDYNPSVLNELKLWGRLLKELHERPLPELREATVEALMLRNLPEASILLAVDAATSGITRSIMPSPSSLVPSLQAIPSNLDFGVLAPGQLAVGEFTIQGGPGRIIVESDQLVVTPLQFESITTRVRVEARPLSGGLLWTSLKLVTSRETLEVPVLAQWTEISIDLSFQEPVVPETTPRNQLAGADQFTEMTALIEQAMNISPSTGGRHPTNKNQQQVKPGADAEILQQLDNLFD